jgi:hypothetical protein
MPSQTFKLDGDDAKYLQGRKSMKFVAEDVANGVQLGCPEICLTPFIPAANSCRIKWTPLPAQIFRSVLRGWVGDMEVDYSLFPDIIGNDVLSTDPWVLSSTGSSVAFSAVYDSYGPIVEGTSWETFTMPDFNPVFWNFHGDPISSCDETVGTLLGPFVNSITRESTYITPPANLTDADIVALGANDSYPLLGGPATMFGPVMRFTYTETFTMTGGFSFDDGVHVVTVQLRCNVSQRAALQRCKLVISGTKPNRVGVFSLTDATDNADPYEVIFNQRWNSATRAPSFFSASPQVETLSQNDAAVGHGWNLSGNRDDFLIFGGAIIPVFDNSSVTLPTFTDVLWTGDC